MSPVKPSQPTVVPQDPEQSPGGTAPTVPDTAHLWLRRFAKTYRRRANLDELTASTAAAASAASEGKTPPANDSNASDPTDPQASRSEQRGRALGRHEGLLVVSPGKEGQYVYSSLQAACNHAKSGDVIELRFNGRLQEVPITISNSRLTIRAGDSFQPVVAFRPEPNPVKYPPSMINVAGGQLRVTNVHWELDVPRDLPGDWALFETRGAELLRFEGCTFTIRNASLGQTAYHAGVAFFDIKSPPGAGSMAMRRWAATTDGDDRPAKLRGPRRSRFSARQRLAAVRLNWDNGLLATSERLLMTAGGPSQPRQLGHVQINLRHVTAITERIGPVDQQRRRPRINCSPRSIARDSILAVGRAAAAGRAARPDAADEYLVAGAMERRS